MTMPTHAFRASVLYGPRVVEDQPQAQLVHAGEVRRGDVHSDCTGRKAVGYRNNSPHVVGMYRKDSI